MEQIEAKILDRDYKLAVSPEDKPRLLQAVRLVDDRMRAIREAGRVSSLDRVAVMAALQLAHELLAADDARQATAAANAPSPATASDGAADAQTPSADIARKIRGMTERLDEEIQRQESLF
jgi:cell division protein ZapA